MLASITVVIGKIIHRSLYLRGQEVVGGKIMIDSDHDLHRNNIRQNMYGFIIVLLIQKTWVRYAPNLVG